MSVCSVNYCLKGFHQKDIAIYLFLSENQTLWYRTLPGRIFCKALVDYWTEKNLEEN